MGAKSIAVLTSGGDAPGMNAAVRAVVRTGISMGMRVYGIRRGYNGLLTGDVEEMGVRSVSDIMQHGGTFLFTARSPEFNTPEGVQKAADQCRKLGVDGVVFGCLKANGTIDMERNRYLLECSRGMSVTMHRAFDRAAAPSQALEDVIALGFDRILTSGQQPKALQGVELLSRLNRQAAGRISLMAGSGVTEQNIRDIHEATGLLEFHFSAREPQPSGMQYVNPDLYMGRPGANEAALEYTTARRVAATITQLMR